jgi:hypothetical protein
MSDSQLLRLIADGMLWGEWRLTFLMLGRVLCEGAGLMCGVVPPLYMV